MSEAACLLDEIAMFFMQMLVKPAFVVVKTATKAAVPLAKGSLMLCALQLGEAARKAYSPPHIELYCPGRENDICQY